MQSWIFCAIGKNQCRQQITGIIDEEAGRLFAGQKSAEKPRISKSRVKVYIDETK